MIGSGLRTQPQFYSVLNEYSDSMSEHAVCLRLEEL
jgi:hypothetical protein